MDPEDLCTAIDMLENAPSADSLVAVTEVTGAHPSRFKKIGKDGILVDAFPGFTGARDLLMLLATFECGSLLI